MTALPDNSATVHDGDTLAPVLCAAHETWIRETDSFLTPIIAQEAPFWGRWTAVRYLDDQFMGQYHRERALVDELRPFLPAEVAENLIQDGQLIAQLQGELDQAGRRRGTGRAVAVTARQLLQSLRSWCAAIEAAAGRIPRDALPEEGGRLLAELEVYTRTHP
jgi:hypothetical protein